MAKGKRLAIAQVRRARNGQWFVSVRKNGRKIMATETYKNKSYANKVARWIKGERTDIAVIEWPLIKK